MENLRFDPAEHKYFVGEKKLPSVTTILKGPSAFYRNAEEARRRGSLVHALSVMLDRKTLGIEEVPSELRPYLDAWISFVATEEFVVSEAECLGMDKAKRYAGTLDRLGSIGDTRWIVDIKTGSRAAWHDLQLGGYHGLQGKGWTGAGRNLGLVYLNKDGTYRFWKVKDAAVAVAAFRAELVKYETGGK